VAALDLLEHRIEVPLVHAAPAPDAAHDPRTLTLFAREVRRRGDGADRPALLFLQGGPGGESPRPGVLPASPPWLPRALEDFRVVLLDQRGTGLSSPLGEPAAQRSATELAQDLTHYRADAIVEDAELLREHLGLERWSLLGQSFGGFCSLSYLSAHPERVAEAFIAGGLPPMAMPVDEIYAATYEQMAVLSQRHYRDYPGDRDRLLAALDLCDAGKLTLPWGEPLTARTLRSIGGQLGMTGGSEALHYLLERDPRSPGFRYGVASLLPFDGASPLYTLVHEACYADGGVTGWSSDRVLPTAFAEDRSLLLGEHPGRWVLSERTDLRPWAQTADLLAAHHWPRLYDAEVLTRTETPCSAVIYVDDPFVLEAHSRATAEVLPGMRTWVTSEWLHNGLRLSGGEVLDRLIALVRDR
jgi:pimeloyl-ACP methyl ester carboxylesterase